MPQNPYTPPASNIGSVGRRGVRWRLSLLSAACAFCAFNAPILLIVLAGRSKLPDFIVHPGYLTTISLISVFVAFSLDQLVKSKVLLPVISAAVLVGLFFAMAAYAIVTR